MRLFFAVPFPDEVRARLAELISELRGRAGDAPVGWVEAPNLHLTLRFLGPVADEVVPALRAAATAVAGKTPAFELVLEGMGTFGGRTPRVLWVGVRDDSGRQRVGELVSELEREVNALGFESEGRPWAAHVTLGRVTEQRGLERLVKAIESQKACALGPLDVPRFVLYESRMQGPRPPKYAEVASFPLQGKKT